MDILVDMDDTIELLLEAWLKLVNERYGRSVKYDDVVDWDIAKAFPGLTNEQVYGPLETDDFWSLVRPMPEAVEGLRNLISKGHHIYIVTASQYQSIRGKMDYLLFRHFPFIYWRDVIITSRKQMLKADILIDDGVHNMEGGDYHKILITAPYNKDYPAEENGMVRVQNWDQIIAEVDRYAAEKASLQENI